MVALGLFISVNVIFFLVYNEWMDSEVVAQSSLFSWKTTTLEISFEGKGI